MIKKLFWLMSLMLFCSCASDFYKPTPEKFATQERISKIKGFAEQFFNKCNNKDYSEIQGYNIDINTKKDLAPENLKKLCEKLLEKTGKITVGKFNNSITPNRPSDFMDLMVFDAKCENNDSIKYAVVSLYRDKDFIYKINLSKTPKPVIRVNFRK
ncbi:hypothetical protein [Epilithonimonas sp.]|uniref:hypothetical protein n=1 Tax=Epilithonimonas sp. TaxID=2894511 RepID=UPI002FDEE082